MRLTCHQASPSGVEGAFPIGVGDVDSVEPRGGRRFAGDERGSATVEYVIWLTLYISLFSVIADLTMIFSSSAEMWSIASDSARRLSMQELTVDEAEAYAIASLPSRLRDQATAAATAGENVTVEIVVPMSAATMFGLYGAIDHGDVGARVVMLSETAALAADELASDGTPIGGP